MDNIYPLLDKVLLKIGQKKLRKLEFVAELGKSDRWLEQIESIDKIQFGVLMDMSRILDFDFILDYYQFRGWIKGEEGNMVAEPEMFYGKDKKISVSINVEGSSENIGQIIEKLIKTGEKEGYKVG